MKRVVVLCVACLLLGSGAAFSGTLYAVADDSDELFRIDVDSQVVTLVGSTLVDISYSGLAWDGAHGMLWVSDAWTETPAYGLGMVNEVTGEVLTIGDHGLFGEEPPFEDIINVMGLAWDPTWDAPTMTPGGRLWGADFDRGGLSYLIRSIAEDWTPPLPAQPDIEWPYIGNAIFVGPWGATDNIRGLAYHTASDTLYGMDDFNLYTIDRNTGAATAVGAHGLTTGPAYIGLEYDSDSHVMYAAGGGNDLLYTVDLLTGAATPLFATGVTNLSGLAYVPDAIGPLFVSDDASDNIYTVGELTGQVTLVGPALTDLSYTGMAFNSATSDLFIQGAQDVIPGHMLGSVDQTTGEVTIIGENYENDFPIAGLAWDSIRSVLWGADTLRNALVEVDLVTGETMVFGCFEQVLLSNPEKLPCTDSSFTNLNIRGLAYNKITDTLFGISDQFLYEILLVDDPIYVAYAGTAIKIDISVLGVATGVGVDLGDPEEAHIGLEWVEGSGRLQATGSANGGLFIVNQLSGNATAVGYTGLTEPGGLSVGRLGGIFNNDFESGDFSGWSDVVQ